eukprot:TRINITY_DN10115_c0_g1_i1.p1 TRINITY_DN10115_c0_g1~~TRINITY_DN10115_c0_g1_i1.p1  ORF type:complete len:505 (+),score=137.98 TRINITY_DN10115_c0_g1_i1:1035-2549(+)
MKCGVEFSVRPTFVWFGLYTFLLLIVQDLAGCDEGSSVRNDLIELLSSRDQSNPNFLEFKFHNSKQPGYVGKLKAVAARAIKEGDVVYATSFRDGTLHADQALQVVAAPYAAALAAHRVPLDDSDDSLMHDGDGLGDAHAARFLLDQHITKLALLLLYLPSGAVPSGLSPASAAWRVYVASLPPPPLDTPLSWPDDALAELRGSTLHDTTLRMREAVRREYDDVVGRLAQMYPTLFPRETFSLALYEWAHVILSGRAWAAAQSVITPLLPLSEAFSYSDEPSVKVRERHGILELLAAAPIEPGDEVVINDGLRDNADLLLYFGFALHDNAGDQFLVGVGLDPAQPLYGAKRKLFERYGILDGQEYGLRMAPPPKALLCALRLWHVSVFDLDDADRALRDQPISHQNEQKVAETLGDLCKGQLAKFETSIKEDKALLGTKLPPRLRYAIVARLGEKRILAQNLKRANDTKQKVAANWDRRTMDISGDSLKAGAAIPTKQRNGRTM